MKLTSLKDLKIIKKEFNKEESPAVPQQQRRSRVVKTRSPEEERARNEGLVKGQLVRLMDTNDTAVIVGFGKDYFELDSEGLVFRASRNEFYPVNAEEDKKLRSSVASYKAPDTKKSKVQKDVTSELTVDLHIERIPGSIGVPEWAALDYQMNYFRQIMRDNLRYKGKKIVFIHGVGDGVLAKAIRKELDEVYSLSSSYTFGLMGVTNVTIK